jgi:hypothetical protein
MSTWVSFGVMAIALATATLWFLCGKRMKKSVYRNELPRVYELHDLVQQPRAPDAYFQDFDRSLGPVVGLVGIEGGVVSGVINLESSGVEAPDWRPRHEKHYHEA